MIVSRFCKILKLKEVKEVFHGEQESIVQCEYDGPTCRI